MTQNDKEQKLDETPQIKTEKDDAELNALARKYRHIGFAFFGGLALAMAAFLLYSAITALNKGDVYDPFTGQKIITNTENTVSE